MGWNIIALADKTVFKMKTKNLSALLCILFIIIGCKQKGETNTNIAKENKEAKIKLKGIWIDEESESVAFKIQGDTIYYPDNLSQPSCFQIKNDTLIMGASQSKYPILKHTNNTFWFRNSNGDVIKLRKSNDPNDSLIFIHESPKIQTVTEILKKDTVIQYNGERYHCYVTVNPTKYKVIRTTYNADGVEADNIYYDNIIHVSVYHGARQLYSHNLSKNMFSKLIPENFLTQAILSNVEFESVDADGFHFNTTLCIPDIASCYMLDTKISLKGKMSMELIDY